MKLDVDELRARGVFSALDRELGRALTTIAGERSLELELAIALLNRHGREGHVRLDLGSVAGELLRDAEGVPLDDCPLPSLAAWQRVLAASKLVRASGSGAPIVFEDQRYLYLARYHEHEVALARALATRAARKTDISDPERARRDLVRVFGAPSDADDLQRLAAKVAPLRALTVVSGGPGTGKTTTVVRILALLLGQLVAEGRRSPRALLLAPTGKAAARLMEAIARNLASLDVAPEVRALIPRAASTIHRALYSLIGPARDRGGRPGHLAADVVIVDEASMVDLALMRALVDAVSEDARLILLGDADQLASVEAGAVLADICGDQRRTLLSRDLAKRVEQTFAEAVPTSRVRQPNPHLSDCIVHLERSHRFGTDTEIGRLAFAIRAGDPEAATAALHGRAVRHIARKPEHQLGPELAEAIIAGFRPALAHRDVGKAVRELERFRVLCAHRRGPGGVEAANEFAKLTLARAGLIDPRTTHYHGRAILVTRNDRSVDLFNGDVGLLWQEPNRAMRVAFATTDGGVRFVSPARLPAHETAFAMSIHKSQGSEFQHVAVLLPEPSSALLSRELFYTAVTRAKETVTVYATADAVRATTIRRVSRDSGLAGRLHR